MDKGDVWRAPARPQNEPPHTAESINAYSNCHDFLISL
jgi:hypothetical protein